VGTKSIGAAIGWVLQFENEDEYCYAPPTHQGSPTSLVAEAHLEQHDGQQLSILRMKLTVNQRSHTVEQAECARQDFLKQLASRRSRRGQFALATDLKDQARMTRPSCCTKRCFGGEVSVCDEYVCRYRSAPRSDFP
jgi:hypothetical protein